VVLITYAVGGAEVTYGVFIQSVVDFIIVALVIFMVVKGINHAQNLGKSDSSEAEEKPKEPAEDIKLLREIRDSLRSFH